MSKVKKIFLIFTEDERNKAVLLLFFSLVGSVFELLSVGMLIPIMLLMTQSSLGSRFPQIQPAINYIGNPSQIQLIVWGMLALLVIYLLKNLYLAYFSMRQARFIGSIQAQLEQRIFRAYLHQPYTFHLQHNSTRLGNNITREIHVYVTMILNNGMNIISESLVLLSIGTLLLLAEPFAVMIIIIVLGLALWAFHSLTHVRITQWGDDRQFHGAALNQHMYEGLAGIKDIILLGREQYFLEKFRLHSYKGTRAAESQAILQQAPRLWLEMLAITGMVIIVLTMISQGKGVERILPVLGLFSAAAFRLIPSVNRVLTGVQTIRFGLPSVNLIYEEIKLLADECEWAQEKSFSNILTFNKEIRLKKIGYKYTDASVWALDDLTIIIKKGESVGFIGPSGSGKSTLVDLILGLLTANKGQITVDGQDLNSNLRAWQNKIGYVPQTIYLADDTLRKNVAFGLLNEEIDDAAVKRAIKDAQLEEYVAGLPNGLETFVGERGVKLSGGQRQRIGIARALYNEPDVLVLDEATSALDVLTEQGVMQAVRALQGTKTIIIVAHRLSTVEHCDRLYRLEQGRLVAEGLPVHVL